MKKIFLMSMVTMLFLSILCPQMRAEGSADSGAGMTATSQEYSDLEKTLKQDRMDNLETRLNDLGRENRFLSERLKMLERSVNDLKEKVDRSFR